MHIRHHATITIVEEKGAEEEEEEQVKERYEGYGDGTSRQPAIHSCFRAKKTG
jgi:hypothetical protein